MGNAGQALQQFRQNQIMSQQAIGTVRGALAANPELNQFFNSDSPPPGAPPEAIKAFLKLQKDGSLPLKDAAYLSQFVQTYAGSKAAQQQQQMVEANRQKALADAQMAQAQTTGLNASTSLTQAQADRMRMLNGMMGQAINGAPGSPNGYPTGGMPQNGPSPSGMGQSGPTQGYNQGQIPPMLARPGVPNAAPQTAQQASPQPQLDNPYGYSLNPDVDQRAFMIRTMRTGAVPDSASIDAHAKDRAKWLDTEQQIGFAPLGNEYDDQGNATARKVVPVSIKPGNPGKLIVGEKPISIDPANPVNLPLIDPTSGRTLSPNAFGRDYNPNAKGAQDELQSAYGSIDKAQQNLSNAKFFSDAVDAYAKDPLSGNRLNALLGTEAGAKFRQLYSGANPVAQIQAAQGKMYSSMIDNLRNEKTGANALRTITQQELGNLQSQYGNADMPPYVQKALAANTVAIAQRHLQMSNQYAQLRSQGLKPADAEAAVIKANPTPPQVVANPTLPDKIPQGAIAQLKAKPALKPFFDQKYGVGSADFILGGR